MFVVLQEDKVVLDSFRKEQHYQEIINRDYYRILVIYPHNFMGVEGLALLIMFDPASSPLPHPCFNPPPPHPDAQCTMRPS